MNKKRIDLDTNELVIQVIGRSNTGKTSIIELLEIALANEGFKNIDVKLGYGDGPKENLSEALLALKDRNIKITLHEVMAVKTLV